MGKPRSELLSGLGTAFEVLKRIVDAVRAQGGSDDDVRTILKNHELRQQMAALIIAANPNVQKKSGSGTETYPVVVPADRMLIQRIEAGKYDWVNSDITPERFPDLGKPGEYALEFVHLNKVVSTEAALAEIARRGLVAGDIGQLLALGEKYPELQRKFPIIALRSVCVGSYGNRCSPYLFQDGRDRDLNLRWIVDDWDEDCRFLAFRKVK